MTEEKKKPDFVLGDGREINFDLYAITKREYDSLLDPKQPDEEEARILFKVSGLDAETLANLPLAEWKKFMRAFYRKAADPAADDSKN